MPVHYFKLVLIVLDQQIYGSDFLQMSREDVGYLYPKKFVLGMKLYKVIQKCRKPCNDEVDYDMDTDHLSTTSCPTTSQSTWSKLGKHSGNSSSTTKSLCSSTKRNKLSTDKQAEFNLPVFSKDIQQPFLNDTVFTTPQRNKL